MSVRYRLEIRYHDRTEVVACPDFMDTIASLHEKIAIERLSFLSASAWRYENGKRMERQWEFTVD